MYMSLWGVVVAAFAVIVGGDTVSLYPRGRLHGIYPGAQFVHCTTDPITIPPSKRILSPSDVKSVRLALGTEQLSLSAPFELRVLVGSPGHLSAPTGITLSDGKYKDITCGGVTVDGSAFSVSAVGTSALTLLYTPPPACAAAHPTRFSSLTFLTIDGGFTTTDTPPNLYFEIVPRTPAAFVTSDPILTPRFAGWCVWPRLRPPLRNPPIPATFSVHQDDPWSFGPFPPLWNVGDTVVWPRYDEGYLPHTYKALMSPNLASEHVVMVEIDSPSVEVNAVGAVVATVLLRYRAALTSGTRLAFTTDPAVDLSTATLVHMDGDAIVGSTLTWNDAVVEVGSIARRVEVKVTSSKPASPTRVLRLEGVTFRGTPRFLIVDVATQATVPAAPILNGLVAFPAPQISLGQSIWRHPYLQSEMPHPGEDLLRDGAAAWSVDSASSTVSLSFEFSVSGAIDPAVGVLVEMPTHTPPSGAASTAPVGVFSYASVVVKVELVQGGDPLTLPNATASVLTEVAFVVNEAVGVLVVPSSEWPTATSTRSRVRLVVSGLALTASGLCVPRKPLVVSYGTQYSLFDITSTPLAAPFAFCRDALRVTAASFAHRHPFEQPNSFTVHFDIPPSSSLIGTQPMLSMYLPTVQPVPTTTPGMTVHRCEAANHTLRGGLWCSVTPSAAFAAGPRALVFEGVAPATQECIGEKSLEAFSVTAYATPADTTPLAASLLRYAADTTRPTETLCPGSDPLELVRCNDCRSAARHGRFGRRIRVLPERDSELRPSWECIDDYANPPTLSCVCTCP